MSIRVRLLGFGLLTCVALSASALDAVPKRPVDLSGDWKLNATLSDDARHMLAERQREEREQYMKWRKQREKMYPPDAPPPIDIDASGPARREPNPSQRASMKRYQENVYKMLAISDTLTIRQDGATVDLVSAVESRRVVAGSHTQVSMPEGELADSEVGWYGQSFVIDRSVRSGPRVVEKFRLLPKTGQLEYQMKWSGQSELRGMKIHRVFDRATQAPPPADPAAGPSR